MILQKATGAVPHGGGIRITRESECYRVLQRYIVEGCISPERSLVRLPKPATVLPVVTKLNVSPVELVLEPGKSAKLQVQAVWSDGFVQEITPWCCTTCATSNSPTLAARARCPHSAQVACR